LCDISLCFVYFVVCFNIGLMWFIIEFSSKNAHWWRVCLCCGKGSQDFVDHFQGSKCSSSAVCKGLLAFDVFGVCLFQFCYWNHLFYFFVCCFMYILFIVIFNSSVQELSFVFPNAQRMNRGGQVGVFTYLSSVVSSSACLWHDNLIIWWFLWSYDLDEKLCL